MRSMHERKALMAELADAFVALPGGLGTFEELCEILTWAQLGEHGKPVVILDVEDFYEPLFALLDRAVDERFLRPEHRALANRARSVAEVLELLEQTRRARPGQVDRPGRDVTGQPEGVPWPTDIVAGGGGAARGRRSGGRLMAQPPELGLTLAVAVVHRGRLVAEAYGPDTAADTTLISWSTAKSVTHALVGLLVGDGRLQLHEPAPVAAWEGDARSRITLQHLLEMRPGLRFAEEYVDAGASDVIEMLFGAGQDDVAAFAAGLPARPRAGHGVELLVRHHEHRRPHRRRRGRWRGHRHARLPRGPAVRSSRDDQCLASFRRCRHLRRLVVPLRHGPGLRPLRLPLPPRRHVGRHTAAARGVGRPRPSARAGARNGGVRLRRALVVVARPTRVPSPPTGTRASTSWWSPTAISWWCDSARRRPSCGRTCSFGCGPWSTRSPERRHSGQGHPPVVGCPAL